MPDDFAVSGNGVNLDAVDADGDIDLAPVDLEQAMGSFSPDWANDTVWWARFRL